MPKNSKLRFETQDQKNKKKKIIVTVVFLITVLVLALTSTFVYFKHKNISFIDFLSNKKAEQKSSMKYNLPSQANILIVFGESDRSDVYYAGILTIKTDKNQVFLVPLSTTGTLSEKNISLKNYYKQNGIYPLSVECEKTYGVNIDRYLSVHSKNIGQFIKNIASCEIDLPQAINYDDGTITLNMRSGKQMINGTEMIKYLRFLGKANTESSMKQQTEFVAQYMNQASVKQKFRDGEALFNSLVNLADSNITIVDFNKYKDYFYSLFDSGGTVLSANFKDIKQ